MPRINKIILLVGLMGSGKTSVGKRLARRLSLPFVDGDQEIEKAAGLSLVDVLKCFGEKEYRAGCTLCVGFRRWFICGGTNTGTCQGIRTDYLAESRYQYLISSHCRSYASTVFAWR